MQNKPHNPKSLFTNGRRSEGKKMEDAKQLYKILYLRPVSRRMAATYLGYTDQTYMVTQIISDWIKSGKAQEVGKIRCHRSLHLVGAISTNPEYFKSKDDNQLQLFE